MSGNFKYRLGFNEFSSKKDRLFNSLLAEFVGTMEFYVLLNSDKLEICCLFQLGIFLLNFFGVASCATNDKTLISLTFGLVVFMAVMVSRILNIFDYV